MNEGFPVAQWLKKKKKKSTCQARDTVSLPGSGRSPGEGNGNPLCLENPMDRGSSWVRVHGVTEESDTTEQLDNKAKGMKFWYHVYEPWRQYAQRKIPDTKVSMWHEPIDVRCLLGTEIRFVVDGGWTGRRGRFRSDAKGFFLGEWKCYKVDCEYTKSSEFYTLDGGIVCYVNHILIKLFKKKSL